MGYIKTSGVMLVLIVGAAALFVRTSGADEKSGASNRFHVTVRDVVDSEDSVVKQIRIEVKSEARAEIKSDKQGGGGLSASAGSVASQAVHSVITLTVFADHVQWKAGDVNALKFLMSFQSSGSKVVMSDTGPMVTGKQLKEMLSVSLESGAYDYGTEIPVLRFKDRTYSLTVTAPESR